MWRHLTLRKAPGRNLSSTVDPGEVQHFKRLSGEWWDEWGYLRPLHSMNKLRIPLIRDGILNTTTFPQKQAKSLEGVSLLDVGCGAGILTEPLARIGGSVTGIDASSDLIDKAKVRAKRNLKLEYLCSTVEEHALDNKERYDAVVASEVVEHVTEKKEFLEKCLQCLKPGGSIFLTTMNKTFVSNLIGIIIAENFLKVIPKGTHQYEKFIKPHHLERILEELNCRTILVQGMVYNFIRNEWCWCSDTSITFALHAIKLKEK